MKRIFLLCNIILLTSLAVMAQKTQQRKFNPEKFRQEMVNYVVREAKLTQQETAAFVPVYKEMLEKFGEDEVNNMFKKSFWKKEG